MFVFVIYFFVSGSGCNYMCNLEQYRTYVCRTEHSSSERGQGEMDEAGID